MTAQNSQNRSQQKTRTKRRRWLNTIIVAVALGLTVWLFVPGLGPNLLRFPSNSAPWANADNGLNPGLVSQLDGLLISSDEDIPEYRRNEFGDGWGDLDGDGCSTRNEVLTRDLTDVAYRPNTNQCVVETGVLADPYTSQIINFKRGEQTSQEVQIDHMVPLANAWYSGAWQWDALGRYQFANDPLNLLAVDGGANFEKGAKTADMWLPPNPDFRCEYVGRQVEVKSRYGLSVTDAEAETMRRVLWDCPAMNMSNWD